MGGINAQAKEREPVFRERSKASHWFKPSQAHSIFEFRVSSFDLARVAVVLIRIPSAALPARKALLKTGSKRTEQGPSPEIVRARETPKRMPGFECVPVAKPGDQ